MEIKQGYVYHIKDSYFDVAEDSTLMWNYENGACRPTCLFVRSDCPGLFWAIPMSTRVEKYRELIVRDTARFGRCDKVAIARYGGGERAFLFQNMFPIISKYVDHIHLTGGTAVPLEEKVEKLAVSGYKECLRLHRRGVKVIFTDVERLERLMLAELAEDSPTT